MFYSFYFNEEACRLILDHIIAEVADDITSEVHGEILEELLSNTYPDCEAKCICCEIYGNVIERFKNRKHTQRD